MNKDRLLKEFLKLISFDSPSYYEDDIAILGSDEENVESYDIKIIQLSSIQKMEQKLNLIYVMGQFNLQNINI